MKKIFLSLFLALATISLNAQVKKSTVQIKKEPVKGIPQNENLIIKFISPSKQPVKSHVKMEVNGEAIFPEMDEKGIYTDHLDPGTYKFNFSVPYWYEVGIEKLKTVKNENIIITVYFTAKDI